MPLKLDCISMVNMEVIGKCGNQSLVRKLAISGSLANPLLAYDQPYAEVRRILGKGSSAVKSTVFIDVKHLILL
jgi:hypothetical protein